jgi:hypothetical protein
MKLLHFKIINVILNFNFFYLNENARTRMKLFHITELKKIFKTLNLLLKRKCNEKNKTFTFHNYGILFSICES